MRVAILLFPIRLGVLTTVGAMQVGVTTRLRGCVEETTTGVSSAQQSHHVGTRLQATLYVASGATKDCHEFLARSYRVDVDVGGDGTGRQSLRCVVCRPVRPDHNETKISSFTWFRGFRY